MPSLQIPKWAHMMYESFDPFLDADTWHTGHPNDDERFNRALARVVRDENFSAEAMGDYFRTAKNVDRENPDHKGFSDAIDKRVSDAWAVRDFFKVAT